ncbi:MAG: DMP19 family protein [Vitreimonas sp.]
MFGLEDDDWLAAKQRVERKGKTALETFQGLIVPVIVVPQPALEGAAGDLVQANVDFVNAMMEKAALLPGEFAPQSFYSHYADYYLSQVLNGGHGQYARNSKWSETVVRAAAFGLSAMGATQHLAILERFAAIMNGKDHKRARAILEGGGFGWVDPEVEALDEELYALQTDSPLAPLNAAWLKSLPQLMVVPANEYAVALERIAASNPLRTPRQAESRRKAATMMASDPLHSTVIKLCAKGGVAYDGLTAGVALSHDRPHYWTWGVKTNIGVCYAVFREQKRLLGRKYDVILVSRVPGKKVLTAMNISRRAYEGIVPRDMREA